MLRRAIALTGLLTCLLLPSTAAAQDAPGMLATSQYLFVLRGDWLYQFDVHSLELRNKVRLPNGKQQKGAGKGATKNIAQLFAFDDVTDVGGGAGGRFGGRPIKEKPESPAKKIAASASGNAVELGLTWLARHQDEDGKWDADGFMKHDLKGPNCTGPGSAIHDVGVTGLALLAFLGAGNTMRSGPYRDNVKLAAKWLREQQQESGLFGTNKSHDFIYDHAIATYAMCEAYGLSNYKLIKQCAQKGINYLESHRNPYSVWRYQPRDNDNDLSVTSWCLIACKAGQDFGLDVNQNALQLGLSWLDQVTDKNGSHGYTKRGENSSRMPGEQATKFPISKAETLTAVGLFCRAFLGQTPKKNPVMLASAELLMEKPPKWDVKAGTIDHYYWYYGTYAMYQMGGDYWKTWQKHLLPAVVNHQCQQGNAKGSWDPNGVWGREGGRVYSTALMTLAMQANYRYSRLVR